MQSLLLFLHILLSDTTMAQTSLPAAPAMQEHKNGVQLFSICSPHMIKKWERNLAAPI